MEKLRIVVVEDEYYVRKGIIQSFDWEKVDCEIVGEAANGKAGIEVVEETKPDLVIGKDARYYHPQTPGADWNEEIQPFGYAGIEGLFNTLEKLMTGETV